MPDSYKIRDQSLPHFITATVIEWIDIFTRKTYRDSIIDCFNFCIQNKGMALYGYVIMSNHVHIIMQAKDGNLSDLIRDFKKLTARNILQKIQTEPESRREWMLERFHRATESHSRNKNYQFWKYGNNPKEIYSNKFLWSKLHYIHLNPIRAGLVEKASHYIYSSAGDYVNKEGLVVIEQADNPVVDVLNLKNLNMFHNY
ncbi:MAG: transposase [Flavobacterium sp.]|nr:MAG: transposase [Flavobacterium sp.]